MAETASLLDRLTTLEIVFGLVAVAGAGAMFAGEAMLEENSQAVAAAGLSVALVAGTIMILAAHFDAEPSP